MANDLRKKALYFDTGDPSTYNYTPNSAGFDYKQGELGEIVRINDKTWQKVQLDSGATSATSVGVVAAGQIAFWKDKTAKLVTNDIAQALGTNSVINGANDSERNNVAGVFTAAITAGNFCAVQLRGQVNLKAASGGTWTAGNWVVANTGTNGDFTTVNAGTAPGVLAVGVVTGARVSPNAPCQLQLPDVQ